MVPRAPFWQLLGVSFFTCVFVGPKAPFWGHFGLILRPQGPILKSFWDTFWPPKPSNWTRELPIFAPFVFVRFTNIFYGCSFRFCPFYKNILHIASTPTPKTSKNILSLRLSQKLPYHTGGGGIAKRFTIYIYIYICILRKMPSSLATGSNRGP